MPLEKSLSLSKRTLFEWLLIQAADLWLRKRTYCSNTQFEESLALSDELRAYLGCKVDCRDFALCRIRFLLKSRQARDSQLEDQLIRQSVMASSKQAVVPTWSRVIQCDFPHTASISGFNLHLPPQLGSSRSASAEVRTGTGTLTMWFIFFLWIFQSSYFLRRTTSPNWCLLTKGTVRQGIALASTSHKCRIMSDITPVCTLGLVLNFSNNSRLTNAA